MNIVLIGSGNVASVLGRTMISAGHRIVQVYSRQLYNGEELADTLGCTATDKWAEISTKAELYIVALSDQSLTELHQHWQTDKGLVVHTAGAVSKDVLKDVSKNNGVLYPLQSLRKEKRDYENIPLLIDASSPDDLALLTDFAESLSQLVKHAGDEERLKLHVAAVMVNNFTNHLYTLAESYCQANEISFELLKPLIFETAQRINDFSPSQVQTGPAIRNDQLTINKHLDLIKDFPALKEIYEMMSRSIQQTG